MSLIVTPYTSEHIPLVKAFNKRLFEKGDRHHFPESNIPIWLPKRPGSSLYQEFFVVSDDEYVRGGYILKYQDFILNGNRQRVANMQLPISEGIVDPCFAIIGVLIARDAVRKAPVMYSLGMGGFSEAVTRLLKAMRWKLVSVPFYFKVINCHNFLRNNAFLRKTRTWNLVLDAAAYSGIGPLSVHTAQFLLKEKFIAAEMLSSKQINTCDEDVDRVWEKVKDCYRLIAVRDSRTIDVLYPVSETRFRRTKVFTDGRCIGWVVTLCTQMQRHKQFGSLRVGSIIDCLCHPDDASAIVRWAASDLENQGADIIVANHSHDAWGRAFVKNGFLRGPSNFIFGASVDLAQQMGEFESISREIFFMRGDGDGPINL